MLQTHRFHMDMLHSFFSSADKKVMLTQPKCDVIYTYTKWHIHINIGINKQAILSSLLVYIDMKHDRKATLIQAVAVKDRNASNLSRHFHWCHLLCKAVRHPSLTILVIFLYELTKDMLLLIQWKTFSPWLTPEMLIWLENSTPDISNSEDFHDPPLEAISRLPRSRDHLFSHSMSKASLPQGTNNKK